MKTTAMATIRDKSTQPCVMTGSRTDVFFVKLRDGSQMHLSFDALKEVLAKQNQSVEAKK